MSDRFATLPFMGIERWILLFVLMLVAAGCGGGSDEGVSATTVPLTVPSTSSTSSTTTTTSTSTTEVLDVETEDDPDVDEVVVAPTTSIVASGDIPAELTWAEEGTPEADVERAFWNARPTRRAIYSEAVLDPNYAPFVESHIGRDLERIQNEVSEWRAEGRFARYPEPSEALVETIVLVTPTEAIVQVCELDRGEFYRDGELSDDTSLDSQFQARFLLGDDGVWLWEDTIGVVLEPLSEGERPECLSA